MKRREFLGGALGLAVALKARAFAPERTERGAFRLLFGSCNKQDHPQEHFLAMNDLKPDLFLWLGDCVYADTDEPTVMSGTYKALLDNPRYRAFAQTTPIEGIWDDHDYGRNNSGAEYPLKEFSQKTFLEFLNVPEEDPRRQRAGVYHSFVKHAADKSVRFIMLDGRYHKTEDDLLGKAQWDWLEQVLQNAREDVTILASGIGVLGNKLRERTEGWDDVPESKERLFALLERYPQKNLLILSGDRHFAAFVKEEIGGRPYLEFMSSGMTHSAPGIAHPFIRMSYGARNVYLRENFGMVDFDFQRGKLVLSAMSDSGEVMMSRDVPLRV